MASGYRFVSSLTPREVEVLKLVATGLSTKQIASTLKISFKTAACHRSHLMDKLEIHEVAGLTRYAIRYGYVELSGDAKSESDHEELCEQIRLTYADYKLAMDEYAAFLRERRTFGLDNPDGSTGARRLREAEKAAHQRYHSALLALKNSLLSS